MPGDLFSQLLECKWRTTSFPITSFSTAFAHDQAQHKWPDRDGAHIEATGRQPLTHRATIPFRNAVARAQGETWGILYPDGFRAFLSAFSDRTSGILQHPELGAITCKPGTYSAEWSANTRDGVNVSATWIESYDEDAQYDDTLARPSPIAAVYVEALDLDSQIAQYANPTATTNAQESLTFTQAIQKITGAFDQVSLVSRQAGGYIDHVIYRVQALQDSIYRARDNTAWPIINTCERLKASLFALKQQQLVLQKDVLLFIVPKDQTLAAVAGSLGVKVADLMRLNPTISGGPVVPRLTAVRYYAS